MSDVQSRRNRRPACLLLAVLVAAGTLFLAAPARSRPSGSQQHPHHSAQVAAGDTNADPKNKKHPGLFGDIPLGGFLTTLAIAVLIGATAGKVYVGVMGESD
jgi:hypothetical protein